jgi:transposase-like protein
MARRKRRNHAPAFKAQVALAALKGDKTLAELAQQHDIHPNQIHDWRRRNCWSAHYRYSTVLPPVEAPDIKPLHAKIGTLTLENDFLESALTKAGLLSTKR